jgi:hypothetical protein
VLIQTSELNQDLPEGHPIPGLGIDFDLDIPPFPPSLHGSAAMVKVIRPCRSLHGDPSRLELDPTSAITCYSRVINKVIFISMYRFFVSLNISLSILCLLHSLLF